MTEKYTGKKNTDYRIYMESATFKQTWRKAGRGWLQRTYGVDRPATAEQVLNHLLALLCDEYRGPLRLRVVRVKGRGSGRLRRRRDGAAPARRAPPR